MTDPDLEVARLREERDAAEHEKAIAQRLLRRAASEIEALADADCEPEAKAQALKAATRLRSASAP